MEENKLLELSKVAFNTVAIDLLGLSQIEEIENNVSMPDDFFGSYVMLENQTIEVKLCLALEAEGCQGLADIMIDNFIDGDDLIPHIDVADAICEILNIAGGNMISSLEDEGETFSLGLPIFLDGHTLPPSAAKNIAHKIKIGHIPAILAIYISETTKA